MDENKKLEPVIENKKPSIWRNLFAEDIRQAKDHVVEDIFIPSLKDTFAGLLNGFVDRIFYGSSRSRKPGYNNYAGYSSLNSGLSKPGNGQQRTNYNNQIRRGEDFIHEYNSRYDAEMVLDGLVAALDKYPSVSVADLHDLSGETDYDFTNNNWGWKSLTAANTTIRPSGGGKYVLILPPVVPIK